MSFKFTSGQGTADHAQVIVARLQLRSTLNVDYEPKLSHSLGLVQILRGPVQAIVNQALGITQQVVTQHAVPAPSFVDGEILGLSQSVVFVGEGIGGSGGGGGGGDSTQLVWATINAQVPNAGSRYFTHDGDVAHSDAPIVLAEAWTLTQATLVVDKADATNNYAVRLYNESGPSLIGTVLTLVSTNVNVSATGLSLSMPAGSFGFRIERTSGSGKSDFDEAVLHFLIERV